MRHTGEDEGPITAIAGMMRMLVARVWVTLGNCESDAEEFHDSTSGHWMCPDVGRMASVEVI